MASATRSRRRKADRIVGRDRYYIIDAKYPCLGEVEARQHAPLLALVQAQDMALRADGPVELHVMRQPLLGGQAHVAYRVVREEDGEGWAVLTYAEED
jgi:hypothetical protein